MLFLLSPPPCFISPPSSWFLHGSKEEEKGKQVLGGKGSRKADTCLEKGGKEEKKGSSWCSVSPSLTLRRRTALQAPEEEKGKERGGRKKRRLRPRIGSVNYLTLSVQDKKKGEGARSVLLSLLLNSRGLQGEGGTGGQHIVIFASLIIPWEGVMRDHSSICFLPMLGGKKKKEKGQEADLGYENLS